MKAGDHVLHYKIIEQLGQGGMGVVYKAYDTKLDRIVALKFLPSFFASREKEIARLKREAQITASLNHPNITTLYDLQKNDDSVFLVMEYIRGETLKNKIKKGKFLKNEALEIIGQIARGLEHAHANNVYHRDIKSDNIMLTPDGQVKIMDFGLAKIKGNPGYTLSGEGQGTIAYMSPEQIEGREIDHRSDIWSLGIVFYEMIAGELPFKGESEATVLLAILKNDPPHLDSFDVAKDRNLEYLLEKLLAKKPENRYQSIDQFLADVAAKTTLNWNQKVYKFLARNCLNLLGVFVLAVVLLFVMNILQEDTPIWLRADAPKTRLTSDIGHERGRISPDGKFVAYTNKNGNLAIKDINSQKVTVSGENTYSTFWSPVWSGDSKKIAIISHEMDAISSVHISGSEPEYLLPPLEGTIYAISWSPDSKWLTYCESVEKGDNFVYTLGLVDTNKTSTIIFKNQFARIGSIFHVGWFPNSEHFAYFDIWNNEKRCIRIYDIVNKKHSDPIIFLKQERYPWYRGGLCYSQDGKYLIYPDSLGSHVELLAQKMTKNGKKPVGSPVPITKLAGAATPAWPAVTQSNDCISYVEDVINNDFYIAPFDLENLIIKDELKPVTTSNLNDYNANWSPDGEQICYGSYKEGQPDIYLWNRDGKTKRLTSDSRLESHIQFLPSGQYVSFLDDGALWQIDIVNGTKIKVLPLKDEQIKVINYTWGKNDKQLFAIVENSEQKSSTSISSLYKINLIDNERTLFLNDIVYASFKFLSYNTAKDELAIDGFYNKEGYTEIHIINGSSGQVEKLVDQGPIFPRGEISWAPDGNFVLFGENSGGMDSKFIFKVADRESKKTRIVNVESKTPYLFPVKISPRGDEIILSRLQAGSDIWAIGKLSI